MRFAGLGVAIAAAALGGCSTAKSPTFSVVDVTVTQRSNEGVVVTFTLEGKNPNTDEPLPLEAVSYSVALDGKQVTSTTRSPEATLPANGSQRVYLPVAIAAAGPEGVPSGQRPYTISGTIIYHTKGAFAEYLFDTDVRRPSVGFSEHGTLDFSSAGLAPPAPETK